MADARGTRFEQGWATLTRVNGTDRPRIVAELDELAPDLARFVVEFGYGDCYGARGETVLTERDRQLVTIGALAAMGGCDQQLEVHANVALNVGATPDQLVEAVMHVLPYVGFPRTLNAIAAVRRVLERRGAWTSDGWRGPSALT